MRTVPCPVTCERHWAGKQSGLCQDCTPTAAAQRCRAGEEEGRRERRGGEEGGLAPASHRGLVLGAHALRPPCCCRVKGSGVQPADGGRARAPTRVCCPVARGCFSPGHNSRPPVAQSQVLGHKPRMSACWTHRPPAFRAESGVHSRAGLPSSPGPAQSHTRP